MICSKCDGKVIVIKKGTISNYWKEIGHYYVSNVEYSICQKCGNKWYPSKTCMKLDKEFDKQMEKKKKNLRVGELITAGETAKILNQPIMDFIKNRRIKNGFITSVKIGNHTFYWKKSVQAYKKRGDGRIKLP